MKWRRHIVWFVLTFFGLLAAGAWFWSATNQPPSAKMPGGAAVTLEAVTRGKDHRFIHGSIWQKLRARLPEKWFGRSGALAPTYRTTNDTVVAWLVWKGKPETLYSTVPRYIVVNDRDERVMLGDGSAGMNFRNKEIFIDGRELILPRQSKTLRLQLYVLDANSKSVCVADFKLPRPPRAKAPSWKPEPLPIRREEAGVEFTLTRFTAENTIRSERGFASPLNTLTFQISEEGQRTTHWRLRGIDASDALGNRNRFGVASYPDRNGDETWTGPWLLWPDEPAWKLRLEFDRRGAFASNEMWRVEGIPVPGRPSFAAKSFQTNLHGISLVVRGITDVQGFIQDRMISSNATFPVLDVRWNPAPSAWVSLLDAQDERGDKIQLKDPVGGNYGKVGYGLNILSNVQSISVTLAVRRSRFIELLAKPEMISTNQAPAAK